MKIDKTREKHINKTIQDMIKKGKESPSRSRRTASDFFATVPDEISSITRRQGYSRELFRPNLSLRDGIEYGGTYVIPSGSLNPNFRWTLNGDAINIDETSPDLSPQVTTTQVTTTSPEVIVQGLYNNLMQRFSADFNMSTVRDLAEIFFSQHRIIAITPPEGPDLPFDLSTTDVVYRIPSLYIRNWLQALVLGVNFVINLENYRIISEEPVIE